MTKFNNRAAHIAALSSTGPIHTATNTPTTLTGQGGEGWTRTPKGELFLIATTSHDITVNAFYDGQPASTGMTVRRHPHYRIEPVAPATPATDLRIVRFKHLVQTVAVEDPAWLHDFLVWLRRHANIRTAAVVGAVEAARAMVAAGIPGGRQILADVLTRPDEPGEAVAYHLATYGRKMPMPVKKGIADAAARLYNERALLKWDTASHAVRFGDVLELTHPAAQHPGQDALFRHAIDRRHGRDNLQQIVGNREVGTSLPIVYSNILLRSKVAEHVSWAQITPQNLTDAGMTWEDVLSLAGPDINKRDLWRNLIPAMGFMARLRNLRNFDQHSLTDGDVSEVLVMLSDEDQVRASRQLPLRFLSAYRAVSHLRWAYPLERALELSLANIPALPGNTLILVDTSYSMNERLSERSDLMRWDAAAVFGLALARRCETAAVVSYSASHGWRTGGGFAASTTNWKQFPQTPGESLLKAVQRWKDGGYFIGGGTETVGTIREAFNPAVHHRVVLLTDEQAAASPYGTVDSVLPAKTPLYTINLAGYEAAGTPSNPYRITLGGLTDAMFGVMSAVESGRDGMWPWQHDGVRAAITRATRPVGAYTRKPNA